MLQVYTGAGKGKTTAAIGLAIRALGADKRVYIMQFMKSLAYSEQKVLQGFAPRLVLETGGKPFFIAKDGQLSEEERKAWGDEVVIFPPGQPPADYVALIEAAWARAIAAAASGKFDVVILDEINVALYFELLAWDSVKPTLQEMQQHDHEIICTGRNAPEELVEMADLVTEMKEIKHYYQKGVMARRGIEN